MVNFIYPTVTRVTSGFRKPGRAGHHGIDYAQAGYHEIKATAAGKVSRSYTSASYGECVMIVHNIGGQTFESVYAHMRSGSRKVSEGQTVKQGQVIGVMGNTGDSTGQHLHFELHKGRWNIGKTNAVDPANYVGVAQTGAVKPSAKPASGYVGKTVYLPKSAATWRTYKTNVTPVKKNSDWSLTPAKFGGLSYKILAEPQPGVVTIKTSRGNRNIFVGAGSGAVIK